MEKRYLFCGGVSRFDGWDYSMGVAVLQWNRRERYQISSGNVLDGGRYGEAVTMP